MGTEYTVVDVDAHYMDTAGDMVEYFEEDDAMKRRFEMDTFDEDDEFFQRYNVFPGTTNPFPKHFSPAFSESIRTRSEIIEVMEAIDIDKILMISNEMILAGYMKLDDGRQSAFCDLYIDYMLDNIVDPDEGIYTVAPLPDMEPDKGVEVVEQCADEDGIVGACFFTHGPEPPLGHRQYDPIYEICEEKDLPVIFHGGGSSVDDFHVSGFGNHVEVHTLGFMFANMTQLTSMVMQGIPERFPDLDVIFQECGLFYVPALMYRLDAEYLRSQDEAPILTKRPSEYMKEFWYGTQPLDEPPNKQYLQYVIEMIGGADRIMYASDYPHFDWDHPDSISTLPFLSKSEKAKILGGNAERVFDI